MTTYTATTKQILRDDIRFIDKQLDSARRHMAEGDKAEAWSILDGLLDYYDFKKHFPDILVNEDESLRFLDMYEALRGIDDLIEIDAVQMLSGREPLEWRPGYSREEILRRLEAFLDRIETWLALDWFEGGEIIRSLEVLKEKIRAFIRFFQNDAGGYLWGPVIDVRNAKKRLLRSLSGELPFAEIYELLMTMDRNLTWLVFRFRLHLDELTPASVAEILAEIAARKHAILAIIDAARAEDESAPAQPPESGNAPAQPPPGWDDLQPFPPPGYGMLGAGIVPIPALHRGNRVGRGAGINSGKAGNFRALLISGLLGLVAGAVIAALLAAVFKGNCPVG